MRQIWPQPERIEAPSMDIELQTELKPDYAHVCCRGPANADDILQAMEIAFLLAARKGRKAILFDLLDLTGEPFGTMDRYAGGTRIVELAREYGFDIAFAFLGNEPMVETERFCETVARNQGGRVRAFLNIDEAVGWFKKSTSAAEAP